MEQEEKKTSEMFFISKNARMISFWCIMAVILFARLYQFGSVPGDINQDEAFAGYNSYTLGHLGKDSFGYTMPMYLTAWGSGMNALESYLAVPFVMLFGAHAWSVRLAPCICAILSLVAVYKIFRKYGGDIPALFVLFFAGIMPWHIMLSRWALESNLAPAFLTFAVFFYFKSVEQEKFLLLCALFYGLSFYAYATIWVVVPFLVLLEAGYLLYCKKLHLNRYFVFAALILGILFLPVFLFLLVNQGRIEEITLPFLSIPKMVFFRGGEISVSNIPENAKNLWNILITQNDGLPWNTTEEYGLIYKISLPFAAVGLMCMIKRMIPKLKKREFSAEFVLLLQLAAGVVVGMLIYVNVNRVNLLFMPLICLTACGIYTVFTWFTRLEQFREWKYYALILPVLVYSVFFAHFEKYYFTTYKDTISGYFCKGLEDVLAYTFEEFKNGDRTIYITPNANYARVLFYAKEDLDTYLETVEYTNYPSAFLDVASFDQVSFSFDVNTEADGNSVYVLDSSSQDSPIMSSMAEHGYQSYSSGNFSVWYPEGSQAGS